MMKEKPFQFVPPVTLEVMNLYAGFISKTSGGSIIRPIFMWQPSMIKDNADNMKIDNAMIPILTGIKTKATRKYLQEFRDFIQLHRMIELSHMQRVFYAQLTEGNTKQYEKSEALRIQANAMRRMTCASLVARSIPCTRPDWNESYKYIHSRTLEQYIALIELALDLPKEWCDDERLPED